MLGSTPEWGKTPNPNHLAMPNKTSSEGNHGTWILRFGQYIHVLNRSNGEISLVEGPCRFILESNQEVLNESVNAAVVVNDNEYAVVQNVWDNEKKVHRMGDREVREGPCMFALHPAECLEDGEVKTVFLLGEEEGVIVEALTTFDNRKAGEQYRFLGPRRFVPFKYERVVQKVDAIHINANEAIYVENIETSLTRMVTGPCSYILDVHEELYRKVWSSLELAAMRLTETSSWHWATALTLQNKELMCVVDYNNDTEKVVEGPTCYLFGPHEGVKVLTLSGGNPKVADSFNVAVLRRGPDYMTDTFDIRTKDNAQLSISVSYMWQFLLDPTDAGKLKAFSINDPIGYACRVLCSAVRQAASMYTFEDFHNGTVALLREHAFEKFVFAPGTANELRGVGRLFAENGLVVTEIDVKKLEPISREIGALLAESIKTNLRILFKKLEAQAELAAQKEHVKGQKEIQELESELIAIENANYSRKVSEETRMDGEASITVAKAEGEAAQLLRKVSAEMDASEMDQLVQMLSQPGAEAYLELLRSEQMQKIPQSWILPSHSTVQMPWKSDQHLLE